MTTGITDLLLDLAESKVPDTAAQMMRLSLFDWAACGIAGAREPDFAAFNQVQRQSAAGASSVLGSGQTSAQSAALINGTLSHALDYDDTHFAHIGHPSVAVVPAVLAVAEGQGADISQLIDAATIGVEGSILTGLWLGRDHYQVGYHQTATAGAFGATLGVCRLLQMDRGQTRQALGLCASMASGIKAQFGTMAKPLNAGLAARSGVEAALWAQAGMTAAADGLAGPLGFGPTHHGIAAKVSLPGDDWHILGISHKFHACCHGLHAMLEALGEAKLSASDVSHLHIHTHPRWMSVCNIPEPATGLEAKFSYRQTAAMTLLGQDTGGIASFSDDIARDATARTTRQIVEVSEDSALSETQAAVDVTLSDGSSRRLTHDLLAPMAVETRTAKLRHKASALLTTQRADTLWEAVQAPDMHGLIAQLVRS